jgi:lipoprotein signal peptidase
MAQRSYRWLAIGLAVAVLAADQGTKYGVFRWLYNEGRDESDGTFQFRTIPLPGGEKLYRGEYNLVPGWFKFTAEFGDAPAPCDCSFNGLQTWSAPHLPRVNHGALFGLGGEHKSTANQAFAGISVLAAAGIVVWVTRRSTAADRWLCGALGLILGGTVGNLYDRIVFNGVRDFLYFYRVDWPVFNVADCCLVVGAVMLLLHAFFTPGTKTEPTPAVVDPAK